MKASSCRSELKILRIVVSVAFYSLKFIGLAPFSVQTRYTGKISNLNKSTVFLVSKIGLFHSVLLSTLVPVVAVHLSPHFFSMSYQTESFALRVIDRSHGILCVFTAWINITNWTFNQRVAVSILNKIFEIDIKLSGKDREPFNRTAFPFVVAHVTINVFLWITVLIAESIEPIILDGLADWFFFIVPGFVIYCSIIEYFTVVGLVVKRLKAVNRNLSSFNEFRCYLPHPSSFLNAHPYAWSLATRGQLAALDFLRKIRTEIFEICLEIAEFFSFPILACVTFLFCSLLNDTNYLVSVFVLKSSEFSIGSISSTVGWIFLSLYPLSLLFYNVTRTLTEAKLTERLVHKLMSTAVRQDVKAQLELFSLQLLHEHFDFTAYGFFTLDFTLLYSMLGAVVTYLIILIQFQQ